MLLRISQELLDKLCEVALGKCLILVSKNLTILKKSYYIQNLFLIWLKILSKNNLVSKIPYVYHIHLRIYHNTTFYFILLAKHFVLTP